MTVIQGDLGYVEEDFHLEIRSRRGSSHTVFVIQSLRSCMRALVETGAYTRVYLRKGAYQRNIGKSWSCIMALADPMMD
jgi:hypothetical protein